MVLQPIQAEAGFEEALGVGIKAGMKNGGMDALSLPRMKQEMVFAHALPRYRRSENKLELMNGARGLQLLYRPSALWRMCIMPRPAFDGLGWRTAGFDSASP